MRIVFALIFALTLPFAYADYPDNSGGFPPPPTSSVGTQTPTTPTTNSPGSDTFGTMVQQQTNQAMQTFQNVNYQKLSGNANQNSFYSDDSSDDNNPPDPNHLFNIFSGS